MKNTRHKIVVLSDLKKSTATMLKSTVSLAKMINGDISFFHVKNPSDVVKKESQLSAIRTINHEHATIDKKIQRMVKSISKDYDINISYSFAFGNIKSEISEYLTQQQPDIIVLGKKKSNAFNFIGDNITQLVLKQHDGEIMIVDETNAPEPNTHISLGLLDGKEKGLNIGFADDLVAHSQQPLKSFKIAQKLNETDTINTSLNNEMIEYVFEKGDDSMNYLSNYLVKNKINLLYVDRMKDPSSTKKENATNASDIKDIISNLKVSLLLTSKVLSA